MAQPPWPAEPTNMFKMGVTGLIVLTFQLCWDASLSLLQYKGMEFVWKHMHKHGGDFK